MCGWVPGSQARKKIDEAIAAAALSMSVEPPRKRPSLKAGPWKKASSRGAIWLQPAWGHLVVRQTAGLLTWPA